MTETINYSNVCRGLLEKARFKGEKGYVDVGLDILLEFDWSKLTQCFAKLTENHVIGLLLQLNHETYQRLGMTPSEFYHISFNSNLTQTEVKGNAYHTLGAGIYLLPHRTLPLDHFSDTEDRKSKLYSLLPGDTLHYMVVTSHADDKVGETFIPDAELTKKSLAMKKLSVQEIKDVKYNKSFPSIFMRVLQLKNRDKGMSIQDFLEKHQCYCAEEQGKYRTLEHGYKFPVNANVWIVVGYDPDCNDPVAIHKGEFVIEQEFGLLCFRVDHVIFLVPSEAEIFVFQEKVDALDFAEEYLKAIILSTPCTLKTEEHKLILAAKKKELAKEKNFLAGMLMVGS